MIGVGGVRHRCCDGQSLPSRRGDVRGARREGYRDAVAAANPSRGAAPAAHADARAVLGGRGRAPVPSAPVVPVLEQRIVSGVVEEEAHQGVSRGQGGARGQLRRRRRRRRGHDEPSASSARDHDVRHELE